ncbi:MAG: UDP-N-acetylglucosamine--undecaprenyl-phosphate N-acetylglucosamine-phosphate transferase, partial [Actinomycetota bacterium]
MGLFGGYVIIFVFAAGTTAAMTPLVLRLSRRRQWLALPGERTVHTVPTPNIGGLAMLCGLAVALLVARQMDRFDRLFTGNSELVGVFIAALIIALVGLRDDVREV